jgi:pimeloyl-ACP methyl ester carboxylesterase
LTWQNSAGGRDDPAFRHVFALQFMPEGTREQWATFDELQRRTATPANAARIMAATADLDVASLAPRVQAPTLVIHSRDDRRAPLAEGRSLATLIPDGRPVVVDREVGDAAGGWAADGGVVAVMVVAVEPAIKGSGPVGV